jgi:hypothetical protein
MPCINTTHSALSPEQQEQKTAAWVGFVAALRLGEECWAERRVPEGLPEPERSSLIVDLLTEEFSYRLEHLDHAAHRQCIRRLYLAWKGLGRTHERPDDAFLNWAGVGDGVIDGRPLRPAQRVILWFQERPWAAALVVAALSLLLVLYFAGPIRVQGWKFTFQPRTSRLKATP